MIDINSMVLVSIRKRPRAGYDAKARKSTLQEGKKEKERKRLSYIISISSNCMDIAVSQLHGFKAPLLHDLISRGAPAIEKDFFLAPAGPIETTV